MVAFSKSGGEAFPRQAIPGMSMRDYFAANAPITRSDVIQLSGMNDPDLTSEDSRSAFFSLWAALCYQWADAMLKERKGSKDDSLRTAERRD